jgi:hypothetical protein
MGVLIFFDSCDKNLIVLSKQLLIPLNLSKDDNSFVIIFLFLKFEIFVLFLLPTVKKNSIYTSGENAHFSPSIYNILLYFVRKDVFHAFKGFYCLGLRLGLKNLFMHNKHFLHALNIKITILNYPTQTF